MSLSYEEIALHDQPDDCWVIINGGVYDVTNFLNYHPGGEDILLNYGGRDATEMFTSIHNFDVILKNANLVRRIC